MRTVLSLFVLFVFLSGEIFSLPRFSVRSGGKCIDCHVNPTGGTMRNESGWKWGKNNLVMWKSDGEESSQASNMIGENVSYGLDFRTQYLYSQEQGKSDFQNMTGSLYFNAELNDKISLFARNDFVWGIWEAYGIANIFKSGYIKAGVFTPNYGIRLDDHTAYTRGGDLGLTHTSSGGLIYDPRYLETGVEFGYNFGELAFATMSIGRQGGFASAAPFSKDPSYTARVEFTPEVSDNFTFMAGANYASHKQTLFPGWRDYSYAGGFLGFGAAGFTLLAEYDIASNYRAADTTSNVMMVELSYKIKRGLDAVVRYDRYDRNTDGEGDVTSHLIVGLEYFPVSFMEIRPQFRLFTADDPTKKNSVVLQFHFWY
ncbi:MAG: hypothetical protein HRU80_06235 [Ignavibacteriales bacterium]|nr:hypothetical protein [Ignavibacteriaceae bacterium]QOJ28492.1 MAG: hypothetical protein HRU80_06235 [Ignavibacteriales bacterium]